MERMTIPQLMAQLESIGVELPRPRQKKAFYLELLRKHSGELQTQGKENAPSKNSMQELVPLKSLTTSELRKWLTEHNVPFPQNQIHKKQFYLDLATQYYNENSSQKKSLPKSVSVPILQSSAKVPSKARSPLQNQSTESGKQNFFAKSPLEKNNYSLSERDNDLKLRKSVMLSPSSPKSPAQKHATASPTNGEISRNLVSSLIKNPSPVIRQSEPLANEIDRKPLDRISPIAKKASDIPTSSPSRIRFTPTLVDTRIIPTKEQINEQLKASRSDRLIFNSPGLHSRVFPESSRDMYAEIISSHNSPASVKRLPRFSSHQDQDFQVEAKNLFGRDQRSFADFSMNEWQDSDVLDIQDELSPNKDIHPRKQMTSPSVRGILKMLQDMDENVVSNATPSMTVLSEEDIPRDRQESHEYSTANQQNLKTTQLGSPLNRADENFKRGVLRQAPSDVRGLRYGDPIANEEFCNENKVRNSQIKSHGMASIKELVNSAGPWIVSLFALVLAIFSYIK